MTNFDPAVMRDLARELYTSSIVRQHGEAGGERLRDVLAALPTVFRRRPPELFADGLTVFATIDPANRPHRSDAAQTVLPPQLANFFAREGTVQVLPNGNFLAWTDQPADPEALSRVAVVYVFRQEREAFAVEGGLKTVRNPNGYPSAFTSPTFFLLEEALTYYAEEMARRSTCHIFRAAWFDDRRLLFVNRPERTMRQSLAQHLRWALKDHAEVREEQNVTETRPIDIKVTWSMTEARSLIEIKWLGKSVDETGFGMGTSYSAPGRTNEGAQQLRDYLEGNLDEIPTRPCTGYLVVFDGRRWGVTTVPPGDITSAAAWRYRDEGIEWPAELTSRDDVGEPRRFWLEPDVVAP